MTPTSAADLPIAREFVRACRDAETAITGLRILTRAGNHELASAMIRALEDRGAIRCVGNDPKCPRAYRGDLVGQLYVAGARR